MHNKNVSLKCSPLVTLSGSGGEEFRGFLVQARTVADGSPVGVFTDNGDDQKLSSCTPSEVEMNDLYTNCLKIL